MHKFFHQSVRRLELQERGPAFFNLSRLKKIELDVESQDGIELVVRRQAIVIFLLFEKVLCKELSP